MIELLIFDVRKSCAHHEYSLFRKEKEKYSKSCSTNDLILVVINVKKRYSDNLKD